jgi:nucleotide-binding universal stress UspA family protein
VAEQLPPDAVGKPKVMFCTYGSLALAPAAVALARREGTALVVAFIRQVALSYKYEGEQKLDIDSDAAAQRTFASVLELGHEAGVPVIPVYDTGPDAAELIAENAAIHGCDRVLIGTSRKGAVYHLIKGHFQRRLESLLPPDISVSVLAPDAPIDAAPPIAASHREEPAFGG